MSFRPFVLVCIASAALASCGRPNAAIGFAGGDAGTAEDVTVVPILSPDSSVDGAVLGLMIAPADAVLDVTVGQPAPSVPYQALSSGQPVAVNWSIERGELGAIDATSGLFLPAGNMGGKTNVVATLGAESVRTSVTVRLHAQQNGDPNPGNGGAGGNGGVGGEGPGASISPPVQQVLQGSPTADPALAFLYPYDKTVWPRGILAPLLQWSAGPHVFDAVSIHIQEAYYDYLGFFAKTATPFVHHPIEQAVWKAMAYSNAGEDVTVTLVFAEGSTAYGPVTQTWKVAGGALKGTVYYNSYGTNLAHNLCCTTNHTIFGGATLAIRGSSTDPVLVAGSDGGMSACRACHSVSAGGSRLVTQHGDNYAVASAYDLKNNNLETPLGQVNSVFGLSALTPDGTMLLSNGGPVPFVYNPSPSALYSLPSGAPVAATGLPPGLAAACPAFSPDGKHVAFNLYGGPGADQQSLAAVGFAQGTNTFSNLTTLYTPPLGTAVWPSFLPTNDGVVFELETAYNGRDFAGTRASCDTGGCGDTGARAELWWVDLQTKSATRLDQANGAGYVPHGPNGHDDDATLNYEPTINPVSSGGYAWVVFTSRRLYGNVATINPFYSDPRFHDLSRDPTTKKLWVAAIDLNPAPGTDPSHPAFYLPAQELLAGNARGFWVVDPCKTDGGSCETGDECCGGYCRAVADGGLMCTTQTPTCAGDYEKCATSADCCGAAQGISCIDGWCAPPAVK